MTGPRFIPDPAELPPAILVDPELRTGAGSPAALSVVITNRAAVPRTMAVTVLGMDATWLPRPVRTRPVMPGESLAVDLTVVPAAGTMPARYPFAVAVEALDPVNGSAASATAIADAALVVDAPSQIGIELDPATTTAVFGRRLTVRVQNSGPTPAAVNLESQSPSRTRVDLAAADLVIPPGQTVPIRGRLRVAHPRLFGARARHTYTVTARAGGAPRHAEGAVTVRAVLGPSATKALVLVAVVAVWVALALTFIPKLSDHVKNGQNVAGAKTKTAAPSGSAGSNGSAEPGGSGGGGGSTGGTSKTGKPGGPKPGGASRAKAPSDVQLNGTVTGDSPTGVAVSISPTSLVNEEANGATPIGLTAATFSSGPIGKTPESALLLSAPRTVSQRSATSTGADGAWSFPSVRVPGYYLLTFAKPGYQTQRYIIDSSAAVATQPLKVQLVAGEGSLHGTVAGPTGKIGAAQVTITDGTNTITTSSNSKGDIGGWSVNGLSTPSTYLVSVSKDGMSTESALITLGAGDSAGVPLTLKTGVASLVGQVQDAFKAGLGDVQVTATDGTTTRMASTVTTGPVGSYVLPDLAPGTYSVTFALDGYQVQTQQVTVARGTSKVPVNATLTSASASVTGTVNGALFNDDGTPKKDADGKIVTGPLNGAGLVLASTANTYKTITTSDGAFGFNGVAPGTYVLSAEYSGLTSGFVTVGATAGRPTAPVTFNLAVAPTVNTSTITGFVGSAVSSGGTLGCSSSASPSGSAAPSPSATPSPTSTAAPATCQVTFTLTDSDHNPVPTRLRDGDDYSATALGTPAEEGPTPYSLSAENGLAPGLYHLTIGATGYLPGSVNIRVPTNGVAVAPQLSLYPANTIAGTIGALGALDKDGAGASYTNCVWAIPEGFSDPTGTITQPPKSCPTAAADLPDQKDCTTLGKATPKLSVIAGDNTYSIGGLCDGSYKVYLVLTNPTYRSTVTPATEAVSHGQTLDYSPHVPRKGRIILTVKRYDATSGAVNSDLKSVALESVSCIPSSPASTAPTTTDAEGTVVVSGVDASTSVSCTVSIAAKDSPTGRALHGTVGNLSVGDDHDTSATITLTQGLGSVIGQVITTYGDGQHPVAGVTVEITGIVGYSGNGPDLSKPVPVKTNSKGCFGIVNADGDQLPTPTWCGELSAADGTLITLPLVGASATVDVLPTPGTAEHATQVNLGTDTTSDTPANVFDVPPKPASTAGLTLQSVPTTAPAANLARAAIRVVGVLPVGAGTVTVSATSSGTLIWTDTRIGSGSQAWPGIYTLTASLGGYISAAVTVNCPLPSASGSQCVITESNDPAPPAGATDRRFVLVALGSLAGSVVGADAQTGATQPLAGATVTATCRTGHEKYPALASCPAGPLRTQTDSAGRYAFRDSADSFAMTPGSWQVSVSAAGYADKVISDVTVDPGANEQAAIQLDALGILNGTVGGVDVNGASLGAIAGATVSAHCEARAADVQQCPATDPSDVKTDSSGRFSFTDPISRYFMLPGAWTITVSADGYSPTPRSVEIKPGTNTMSFTMNALGSLAGRVTGLGSLPLSTATVSYVYCGAHGASCPSTGAAATNTDTSGRYSITASPTTYSLALGDWQLTVSAPGYIAKSAVVNVTSGPNPTDFALTARGTLTGTVTGLGDAPVAGATVSLHCLAGTTEAACPATDPAPQRTDSSGLYSFVGSDTLYVLTPGTWRISVSTPGYNTNTNSDLTIVPGANSYSPTMTALGTLSGHLLGYLGTDTTYPSQPLSGATVSAVPCTDSGGTVTCPSTDAGARKATSNFNGDFQIVGPTSPFVLDPGTWQVTISMTGYTAFTQQVSIAPGANSLARNYLFVSPVSVAVGIETAPSVLFTCPTASPTCAQVVLTRTDTREQYTVRTADASTSRYLFTNMIPATYSATVTGAGLLQTTTQITVLPGSNGNYDLPVGVVQNTVSGLVTGPGTGRDTSVGALNGVPVELGHMDTSKDPAVFVPAKGTDGNDLVTTTATNAAGVAGAFSFTTVRNGTYVARYNADLTGHPAKDGYLSVVSTSFVDVTGGQATSFPTAQLGRVTHKVTLSVSTTDSNDNVSGATNVQLTAANDPTATISAQPPTTSAVPGGGNRYSWVFNSVPSGQWLSSITLPSAHYGTLSAQSGSDAMSCSAGTASAPVACTSTSGAPITVNGKGAGADTTEAYTLDEYLVGVSVVAVRLPADPNATPPATVSLSVKNSGTTVLANDSFTVSTSSPSPPTATFWGAAGATYTASMTTTATNWVASGQTYTSADPSRALSLTETDTTVQVSFSGTSFTGDATVTLTPPDGSGITPPATQVGQVGASVRFSGIPYGSGWKVHVDATKHVDAVPGTPASDTPVTGDLVFNVTGSTTVTVPMHT